VTQPWKQASSLPREVPATFSPQEMETLKAAVDQIIPPSGDGFPSAGEVGVHRFIARHLPPDDDEAFRAGLHALEASAGGPLASVAVEQRIAALRAVERERPDFFRSLLRITYYGYYSRPAVAQAIRDVLGYDYNDHPQPYGYRLPPFDACDPLQKPAAPRGAYVETASVRRVRRDG
jgi:Gluconate 2-dehydrogenase subunit 3